MLGTVTPPLVFPPEGACVTSSCASASSTPTAAAQSVVEWGARQLAARVAARRAVQPDGPGSTQVPDLPPAVDELRRLLPLVDRTTVQVSAARTDATVLTQAAAAVAVAVQVRSTVDGQDVFVVTSHGQRSRSSTLEQLLLDMYDSQGAH